MSYRWLLVRTMGLAMLVGAALLWSSLNANVVFYLTPTEAIDRQDQLQDGERFRLGGLVDVGSVMADGDVVRFVVTDGNAAIQVVHRGFIPQLFQDGLTVLVEGGWSGGLVASDTLIIRHDEEYRVPVEPASALTSLSQLATSGS